MDEVHCQQCRMVNSASASFCSRCGAAIVARPESAPVAGASGWELATAGMSQPAPQVDPFGELRSDELAGWWQRLGGAMLDGLLQLLALAIVLAVAFGVWWAADPDGFETFFAAVEQDAPGFDETDWLISGVALAYLVFVLLWDVLWIRGTSMGKPGQRAAGFRVVVADDVSRVGTGRAIGRFAGKTVLSVVAGGLAAIASAFTIGLSSKKQSVHDMMAGTACVRTSALQRRGIVPGGIGPHVPMESTAPSSHPSPVSMQDHVGSAPNRSTTEEPPPLPPQSSSGSGPFV